jgi:CBS domain-containing protein
MHASTATVTDKTTIREALRMLAKDRCDALPIIRDGRPVGLLTEADLLRVFGGILADDETAEGSLGAVSVALGNPVVQSAMHLLSEAGI